MSNKSEYEFDVGIIGGGSAGFTGAVRGWDFGKKVAIIYPENKVGGATFIDGALASKVNYIFYLIIVFVKWNKYMW